VSSEYQKEDGLKYEHIINHIAPFEVCSEAFFDTSSWLELSPPNISSKPEMQNNSNSESAIAIERTNKATEDVNTQPAGVEHGEHGTIRVTDATGTRIMDIPSSNGAGGSSSPSAIVASEKQHSSSRASSSIPTSRPPSHWIDLQSLKRAKQKQTQRDPDDNSSNSYTHHHQPESNVGVSGDHVYNGSEYANHGTSVVDVSSSATTSSPSTLHHGGTLLPHITHCSADGSFVIDEVKLFS